MSDKNNKNILYCSFFGSQHEVRKLIAGQLFLSVTNVLALYGYN